MGGSVGYLQLCRSVHHERAMEEEQVSGPSGTKSGIFRTGVLAETWFQCSFLKNHRKAGIF